MLTLCKSCVSVRGHVRLSGGPVQGEHHDRQPIHHDRIHLRAQRVEHHRERFSPNLFMLWLHTAVVISSTRVRHRAPNTILGLIPIGEASRTVPLRNIASVDANTRFNIGNLLTGIIAMPVGMNPFSDDGILEDSHPMLGFILLIVAIASLLNTMTTRLNFANQNGETNTLTVSILEQEKLHHHPGSSAPRHSATHA